MAPPIIAVISHDPLSLAAMREAVIAAGYRVAGFLAGDTALLELRALQPSLIILDVPSHDRAYAWELIARMHAEYTGTRLPLIVCSEDIFFLRKEAEHLDLYGYSVLAKPFTRDALSRRIADHLAGAECAPAQMPIPERAGTSPAAQ